MLTRGAGDYSSSQGKDQSQRQGDPALADDRPLDQIPGDHQETEDQEGWEPEQAGQVLGKPAADHAGGIQQDELQRKHQRPQKDRSRSGGQAPKGLHEAPTGLALERRKERQHYDGEQKQVLQVPQMNPGPGEVPAPDAPVSEIQRQEFQEVSL